MLKNLAKSGFVSFAIVLVHVISVPFLSIHYDANSFGYLAQFVLTANLFSLALTLRLELAALRAPSHTESLQISAATFKLAISLFTVASFLAFFLRRYAPGPLYVFLPVAALTTGALLIFQSLYTRLDRIREFFWIRLSTLLTITLMQYLLRSISPNFGLIYGLLIGQSMGLIILCKRSGILQHVRSVSVLDKLRPHVDYVIYNVPSAIMNRGTLALPSLIIPRVHGMEALGHFYMAWRVSEPVFNGITQVVSGHFWGDVFKKRKNVFSLFRRYTAFCAVVSTIILIAAASLRPIVQQLQTQFSLETYNIMLVLMVSFSIRCSSSFSSQLFSITGANRKETTWQLLFLLVSISCYVFNYAFSQSIFSLVTALSIAYSVMYTMLGVLLYLHLFKCNLLPDGQ